jgi:hypothetical protein
MKNLIVLYANNIRCIRNYIQRAVKYLIEKTKYKLSWFSFLEVLNSPLVSLKLKWYFGDITQGTPYFLPGKWVKSKEKTGYLTPIQIKYFGINIVYLGWKTKYNNYRFEWNPMISIVLFGKQFCIWFIPKVQQDHTIDSYWEAWLTYKYKTKGTKFERLIQLFEKYSCTWVDNKTKNDHYLFILKKKYLKTYLPWKMGKH